MAPLAVLAIQLGLLQAASVHAADFTPNCTIPAAGVNFVRSATTRGTMDILWSCLSIFILCTWTILHLNVPRVRPAAGKLKKIWFTIVDSRTKIKWMLITMVMPELILLKAVNDLVAANEWISTSVTRTKRPVQNYLANMGHFVLDWGHADDGPAEGGAPTLVERFRELQPHIDAVLRTNADSTNIHINAKRLKSRYWALNARQWGYMKEWGIAELPGTPDYQLERLDSGGGLVKIIALVQIFWLALQLLVRLIRRHPSSQLEVAALAFAILSALTYWVNFSKPHDVAAVCIVRPRAWGHDRFTKDRELQDMMERLAAGGPAYLWKRVRLPPRFDDDVGPSPIPNDGHINVEERPGEPREMLISALIISAGGLVFSGIHCAAWNSTFPTPGERTAWRCCAIITVALALMPLIMFGYMTYVFYSRLMNMLVDRVSPKSRKTRFDSFHRLAMRPLALKTFGLCLLVPYTLARLFLIVEIVRALFYSPPEVYRNTWTAEIVHT